MSSAGQGKFAGQRPTFYHCATPPNQTEDVSVRQTFEAFAHQMCLRNRAVQIDIYLFTYLLPYSRDSSPSNSKTILFDIHSCSKSAAIGNSGRHGSAVSSSNGSTPGSRTEPRAHRARRDFFLRSKDGLSAALYSVVSFRLKKIQRQ